MSRILLLNPPGTRNYIRDYFCSKISKSNYISPPVTLLTLSGMLSKHHDVAVLDAIVEGLDPETALERCRNLRPDAVIALAGAACWEEDRAFLGRLKDRTRAYLIGIGDVLLENTEARLKEAPGLDAVLLHFGAPDVLALLETLPDGPSTRFIPNVVYRNCRPGFVHGGWRKQQGEFRVGCPRHDLFPLGRYRFPFMTSRPMTAMLTDYGCPFTCSFCVITALGFGLRPLSEVGEELESLARLGVREIFFLDQTFGVKRDRTLQLCRMLEKHRFQWSCFSRADVLPPDALQAMAAAGCHTIIFGVESGNDQTLARYQKKTTLAVIRERLAECRAAGIRVAATFLLGLPGESEEDVRQTIRLALALPIDYVSFNVAVPRAGTQLRQSAIAEGLISPEVSSMDQSGLAGAMATRELPAYKVMALRREAIRRFYLRPGYLLRRLLTLRSWWDFRTQFEDGWGVVKDALGMGKNEK